MNDYPRALPPSGRPDDGNGNGPDEQRLRRLLHEAVSDVEPRDALGSIHARTEVSTMSSTRPWLLAAGAAVVATAATVAAVTVLSSGTPDDGPGFAAPTKSAEPSQEPSPSASPSPTEQAGEVQAVPVYYVGDTSRGPRLFREFHQIRTGDALLTAVDEAVMTDPDDPDYRSPWPDGARAGQVSYDGDVITVSLEPADGGGPELDLHDRPAGMSEEEARMAVEQVIYTAQAALQQGRPPVQFLVNGQRTDQLLGVPVSEPLSHGDAVDVLAQVWIIEPSEGAELTSPFTVSGLAAAFEANVVWELRRGDTVVRDGFTTAEECCTMAPYEFEVEAPPGEYTLVVQDTDASGGEGFAPWRDTKRLVVTR
jgi:hypothetical protein